MSAADVVAGLRAAAVIPIIWALAAERRDVALAIFVVAVPDSSLRASFKWRIAASFSPLRPPAMARKMLRRDCNFALAVIP